MKVRVLPTPQFRSVLQLVDGSDLESGFCGFESHPIDKFAGMHAIGRQCRLKSDLVWVRIPLPVHRIIYKYEDTITNGLVAQPEEAAALNPVQCGFESHQAYKYLFYTKFS